MSAIVAIYKPCYNFAIGELNKKKYVEFYINLYTKNRNVKRWNKRFKKLFGNFITRDIFGNLFINCKEIKISQGWFFKDKVFKAKEPIWYSTTKKKSKELLYKLINDKYKIGKEVKKEFLNIIETLEDNKFIFEIIW